MSFNFKKENLFHVCEKDGKSLNINHIFIKNVINILEIAGTKSDRFDEEKNRMFWGDSFTAKFDINEVHNFLGVAVSGMSLKPKNCIPKECTCNATFMIESDGSVVINNIKIESDIIDDIMNR